MNQEDFNIDWQKFGKITFDPIPEDKWQDSKVVFYCKNCQKVIDNKKEKYTKKFCPYCKKILVLGTEKSMQNFFHLKKLTKE